jgi:hypothetical protein
MQVLHDTKDGNTNLSLVISTILKDHVQTFALMKNLIKDFALNTIF